YALPPTAWEESPDLKRALQRAPYWNAEEEVRRERPLAKTTDQALVPRSTFANWLLLLEPGPRARPVELEVTANVIDEALRARQLMQMRARYDPQTQPERVREAATYLTDDEVHY